MIESPEFFAVYCRVFKQVKNAAGTDLTTDSGKQKFRVAVHSEIAAILGGDLNADKVAQKRSALKDQFAFPPMPQGKKGRRIDPVKKAAANVSAIESMADAGYVPVYAEDGVSIVDWAEAPEVEAEVEAEVEIA